MSAETKAMTLRLPQELAEDLATVAMVDGQSMNDTVSEAIGTYLWRRMAERDWEAKRDAALDRINRLAKEPDDDDA